MHDVTSRLLFSFLPFPYALYGYTHLSSLSTFPPPLPETTSSPLLPFIFNLFSFFSPFCTHNESKSQKTPQRKSQWLAYTCSFCNFFLFLPFSITGPTSIVRFAGRSPSAIHCQQPTYPSFPFSISSTFPTFSLFLSHFLTTQTQLFMLKHSYTFYVDFFYLCIFEFIFFLIKVSAVMTL